ncbi:MAG: hypothetical protein KAS72_09630 [Phycisphaerales bacterium]|nr:hypothetical protein [Phycisphaerales bacterium]
MRMRDAHTDGITIGRGMGWAVTAPACLTLCLCLSACGLLPGGAATGVGHADASLDSLATGQDKPSTDVLDAPIEDEQTASGAEDGLADDLTRTTSAFEYWVEHGTWPGTEADDPTLSAGEADPQAALTVRSPGAGLAELAGDGASVDPEPTPDTAVADSTEAAPQPVQPIEAPPPDPVELLLAELRRDVQQTDAVFYAHILLALSQAYAPGTYDVPPTSDELAEDELAALRALSVFAETIHNDVYRDNGREPLIEAVRALSATLSEDLPLTIPVMELVQSASGLGQYQPLANHKLLMDRPHRIGVYVELENFTSHPDDDGLYRVELGQTLALYKDEDGTQVWREPEQRYDDVSRNRRRDFFLAVPVDLPRLSVGTYQFKVTMRDLASGAIAERTIELEVVADARMTLGE